MQPIEIDPSTTALVVIDLQKGIVSFPAAPHATASVVANAASLARAFRAKGGSVFLVRVTPSSDKKDALVPETDSAPMPRGNMSPEWADIVPELGPEPNDFVITKRQWGAFYGTELDLQLRRRGIRTIVLCGIATAIGVESTARAAYELGYNQVFVEDAMSSRSPEEHAASVGAIFPRMGRVRLTAEVLAAIK
jgi:nicotinamidase-related amidase